MLFLGNSYTFFNDLEQVVESLLVASGTNVTATRLAEPGWRLVDHLDAVGQDGTAHAIAFAAPLDWVILQEQSQIPGFPRTEAEWVYSREAAVALDGLVTGAGGDTMFLMTWGRRDGDPDNRTTYPDYRTMQDRLDEGYRDYVAAASADGTPAWIAPAGRAWSRVWDDVEATGADPTEGGNAFHGLYVDDGSHPSARGTYLAACVVYASLTGESPEGLPAPEGVPDAAYLQAVAAAVVIDGEADIVYPWTEVGPDDTGDPDDTGGSDTDVSDTDVSDTDDTDRGADGTDTEGEGDPSGCGCGAPVGVPALASIAALGALAARRRPAA